MTSWRVSVHHHDGQMHDVVIDATVEATVAKLWGELSDRGFSPWNALIDGQHTDDRERLDRSPLRDGSGILVRDAGRARRWLVLGRRRRSRHRGLAADHV